MAFRFLFLPFSLSLSPNSLSLSTDFSPLKKNPKVDVENSEGRRVSILYFIPPSFIRSKKSKLYKKKNNVDRLARDLSNQAVEHSIAHISQRRRLGNFKDIERLLVVLVGLRQWFSLSFDRLRFFNFSPQVSLRDGVKTFFSFKKK